MQGDNVNILAWLLDVLLAGDPGGLKTYINMILIYEYVEFIR